MENKELTVGDLKKILKNMKDDALITFWGKDTNMQYGISKASEDEDGNLWLESDGANYACYIFEQSLAENTNSMHINNLRVEGVKGVYNEEGEYFTVDYLEQHMNEPEMVGPYYLEEV